MTPTAGQTVAAALAAGRRALREAGILSAALDAELLLGSVLGCRREAVLTSGNRPLEKASAAAYATLLERRLAREPVARILGEREFRSLSFRLNPETLVPRPDSETLIDAALDILHPPERDWRLLDLGTGSGCLLLALLDVLPAATGLGTDISADALAAARDNAERLGLAGRAEFAEGAWRAAVPEGESFDLVLSNPPYVPTAEIDRLMPEVAGFEPRRALDGGPDGLDAYRRIAAEASPMLRPGGHLLLELGHGQSQAVAAILLQARYRVEGLRPDLAGIERVVIASPDSAEVKPASRARANRRRVSPVR